MQVDGFGLTLAALNLLVASLNTKSFVETGKATDFWSAIAWFGSTCYWVVRGTILQ